MATITPKRQTKPQSKEVLAKKAKISKKFKEDKLKNQKDLGDVKNEIFANAQKNFPQLLVEKVSDIIEEVSQYCEEEHKGLIEAQIAPLIASRTKNFYAQATYSTDELYIAFNEFVRLISEINKKVKFLPSKKKFCSFIGISTATYDSYLVDFDEDKRCVAQMIDDYISDINLTSAQNGEIREITTIFRSKAEHKMIEAQSPIVMEYKKTLNYEEVKDKLKSLGKFIEIGLDGEEKKD